MASYGPDARSRALGWAAALLALVISLGCSGFFAGDDSALVQPAEALLQQGDLPGAADAYQQLAQQNPDSVSVAVGLAYVQLLQGDIVGADTTLANIEPKAGDKVGEIRLRRAIVALEAGDYGRVKMLGISSELPEGKLLAAEVSLVDLEIDSALALLKEVVPTGGVVGETASTYVSLLESSDQHKASLAEASALWALGDRAGACGAVEDSLKAMAEDDPSKDSLLLLWAGRSVVSGKVDSARRLLEDAFPPDGQEWRFKATQAMITLAEGRTEEALAAFQVLREDPSVPKQGLQDALATACGITKDPNIAAKLVEGLESAAAAKCLGQVGAPGAAQAAPAGPLQNFLENP
jgi:thioredoxin-like negative regulator of GroEL